MPRPRTSERTRAQYERLIKRNKRIIREKELVTMTLYEYLSRYQTHKKDFCRKVGISIPALYKYINLERTPALDIAIKINKITSGIVGFEDMLPDPSRAKIKMLDEDLL